LNSYWILGISQQSLTMTLPKYALAYNKKCSPSELRSFVGSQTGTTPPRNTSTKKVIKMLKQLDRDTTRFRFFDMPPEMRNLVYRELLTWPDDAAAARNTCSPQILASCSQALEKAKGILWDDQLIIKLEAGGYRGLWLGREVVQTNYDIDRMQWPKHLRHMRRLLIDINAESHMQALRINEYSLSLVKMLSAENKLAALRIRCSGGLLTLPQADSTTLARMIWPLAKLENEHLKLEVEGSPETMAVLSEHRSKTSMSTHALMKALANARRQLDKYHDLSHHSGLAYDPSATSTLRRAYSLTCRLERVDWDWEIGVIDCVRNAKQFLQEMEWDKLQSALASQIDTLRAGPEIIAEE
jgi:hypothetical protein